MPRWLRSSPTSICPPPTATADDLLLRVNQTLETARDARRVFRLEAGPGLRAYFILPADRAKRLSKILPFA